MKKSIHVLIMLSVVLASAASLAFEKPTRLVFKGQDGSYPNQSCFLYVDRILKESPVMNSKPVAIVRTSFEPRNSISVVRRGLFNLVNANPRSPSLRIHLARQTSEAKELKVTSFQGRASDSFRKFNCFNMKQVQD